MNKHYRKLLLTSALVLISFKAEALHNEMEPPEECAHMSSVKIASAHPRNEIKIPQDNLLYSQSLGKIAVVYKEGEFSVQKDNANFNVKRHDLSKELRGITEEKLRKFLTMGYLSVKKIDDDYGIDANLRLLGGGPVAAVLAGLGTCVAIVGAAVTGNAPLVVVIAHSAPAIIGAAAVSPTP